MIDPRLESALSDLLADGPKTIEVLLRELSGRSPFLAARGREWLENQLDRSPSIRRIEGGRYGLGTQPEQLQIELPDELARPSLREVDTALARDFIVLDLEANPDRSDPADHEIIEIGACRVVSGAVADEFHSFVAATRPLIEATREISGIQDADLDGAPTAETALARLAEFVDSRAVVAHNGFGYDFPLLDRSCSDAGLDPIGGPRLDSLELAHLVFPRVGGQAQPDRTGERPPTSRSLDDLSTHLGLTFDGARHRAVDDARATCDVVALLLTQLRDRAPQRMLQRYLLHHGGHPWAAFVPNEMDPPPLIDLIAPVDPPPEREGSGEFDLHDAVAPLSEGGALMRDGRSPRPEQVEMARAVAEALAHDSTKLIEAPTGTGKTLAYVVPAIEFARASGQPVVVASHSKVLQDQVQEAIQQVESEMGPVRSVVLKGLENYVSLERLEERIGDPPDDPDEAFALAVIADWVARTPTGEWDDLRAWMLDQRYGALGDLRWSLRLTERPGLARDELDRRCFYRATLEAADRSDIAILNHALLVSRNDWLDWTSRLVLDEAHQLEESATAALSEEVSEASIDRLLRAVHDPWRRWGSLGRYLDATRKPRSDPAVRAVEDALAACRVWLPTLGQSLLDYVRDRLTIDRETIEQFGATHRIRRGVDTARDEYKAVIRPVSGLRDALRLLAASLGDLEIPDALRRRYRKDRLEREIARITHECVSTAKLLDEIAWAEAEDVWINIADVSIDRDRWVWGLRRVPLSVAPFLRDLWSGLDGIVLTSATLSVAGSFTHLIDRLGLGAVDAPLAIATPFHELSSQELLVLPDHLPTPRGSLLDAFTRDEADELARLFLLTGGRGMALFTARRRMLHARDHVRPSLDPHQLPVICQGDDPAPALLERFREEPTTSLLATRSFWEGVDIPGESLSLLVIEKLPFDSPGDPVVAARMEAVELSGRDPFGDYLVPQAVLRFVQGIGRLIRTSTDTGVAVVLDKRLRLPVVYRDVFLNSLPGPPSISRPETPEAGYRAIAEHLDIELDAALLEKIRSLPSSDRWADLSDLELSDEESNDDDLVRARLDEVRDRLGFDAWRPDQLEIMIRFLRGEDALAVMPTGSGKSLTFQIPALIRPGLTIVISPLVALMRDQVRGMQDRELRHVAAINSGVSQAEQEEILREARAGRIKLIYISPERLWVQRFREALRDEVHIARIAVDEAHCVSQWGHTFRPEYSAIAAAVRSMAGDGPRPPVLAVTATATAEVQQDIMASLELRLPAGAIVRSPDRPELDFYVEPCSTRDERDLRVVQILDSFRNQSAIVYVPRRDDTNRLAGLLRASNHTAAPYHGGMEPGQRQHLEQAFNDGEIDVVVATKAFGLGIDKPDISLIVHLEMPASIEEYVQEAGRAARGAVLRGEVQRGTCVLLRTPRDCRIHQRFVSGAAPEVGVVKAVWSQVPVQVDLYERPEDLYRNADGEIDSPEEAALSVHYLVSDGVLERFEDVAVEGRVLVPGDASEQIDQTWKPGTPENAAAHRLVAVAQDQSGEYRATHWARELGALPDEIERWLLDLFRRNIIGFSAWRFAWHLRRRSVGEPDWAHIDKLCHQRRSAVQQMSSRAKEFARQDSQCRRAWFLSYLGAPEVPPRCDACDVCVPDLPRPWRESTLSLGDLAETLPISEIILAFLDDVEGAQFGEGTLVGALAGAEGRYSTPDSARAHPAYGRLAALQVDGVKREIDRLCSDGLIRRVEASASTGGRSWTTLQVTDKGRRRL